MNYRHLYHAGSFSDVFKHFIFTELLLKLREKKTPFCVIDTHAGLGLYNIHSMEAQKTLEYQTGIEYFLQNALKDPDLDAYIRVIRSVNGSEEKLKNLEEIEEIRIRLVGVVQLHGENRLSGHYTAICKKNNEWIGYNDSSAYRFSQSCIQGAYLLIYERI